MSMDRTADARARSGPEPPGWNAARRSHRPEGRAWALPGPRSRPLAPVSRRPFEAVAETVRMPVTALFAVMRFVLQIPADGRDDTSFRAPGRAALESGAVFRFNGALA